MFGVRFRCGALALGMLALLVPSSSHALPTELVPLWSAVYGYSPTPATPPSVGIRSDSLARALAIAVSPDGSRAYVTGNASQKYASLAYDTTGGAELWVARLPGSSGGWGAADIAMSPGGTRAYVTGRTFEYDPAEGLDFSYTSVAYDASTGAQLWTARYDDPLDYGEHWGPAPQRLAVSPDGTRVYVAAGLGTVAYDAADGSQLWLAPVAGGSERLDVSPDGAGVYVSGPLSTVALDAVDGSQIWVAPGTGRGGDFAMSPDGASLYVVDPSFYNATTPMTTSSYDAADGSLRWSFAAYDPNGEDPQQAALAVGPNRRVFVTAAATTLAFNDQGSLIWLAQNSLRGTSRTLSVSPDGLVYVSGSCSCQIGGGYPPTPSYDRSESTLVAYDYAGNEVSTTPFEAEWSDVALSPDGSRLLATGRIAQEASGAIQAHSYATVAFCAGVDRALLPLDGDYLDIPRPPACPTQL